MFYIGKTNWYTCITDRKHKQTIETRKNWELAIGKIIILMHIPFVDYM